jgi:hypothetical protein
MFSPKYLVLLYILINTNKVTIKTHAIKDNGTTRKIFLNESFAQKYNLIITKLD